MKNIYTILAVLAGLMLAGCVEYYGRPDMQRRLAAKYAPQCRRETTVAVYDKQGTFEVPGCVDYYYPEVSEDEIEAETQEEQLPETRKIKRTIKKTKKIIPQVEEEITINEDEFPEVGRNKYIEEVILQNQNTGVLAYCRGTEQEIEICVSRLENSCYVRLEDIPSFAAKYDYLKTGTYPTRRWREGEYSPRW